MATEPGERDAESEAIIASPLKFKRETLRSLHLHLISSLELERFLVGRIERNEGVNFLKGAKQPVKVLTLSSNVITMIL
jgi:hypothetical protein